MHAPTSLRRSFLLLSVALALVFAAPTMTPAVVPSRQSDAAPDLFLTPAAADDTLAAPAAAPTAEIPVAPADPHLRSASCSRYPQTAGAGRASVAAGPRWLASRSARLFRLDADQSKQDLAGDEEIAGF